MPTHIAEPVPNQAIAQLCQTVAIAPIHIRSFTGVQTTEQLVIQIKAWLSEI